MASDAPDLREAIALVGRDPARAELLARAALSARPDDVDASAVLAAALRERGDFEAARRVLEPLVERGLSSWVLDFEWAQVLAGLGRSREAPAALERALAVNPGVARAWRLLGDIRLVSGDFTRAQGAYDRMLCALAPDARLQRAAADLADGRLERAERALRALLAGGPLAAAHLLGEVLARQGRSAEALTVLAECLARAPGLHLARQAYALALNRAGRQGEALAQLDQLLEHDPSNNRCRIVKAAILTGIGDHGAAAEVTASVLGTFPDQPHAWLLHGHGLRTLGRIDESITAYRRCLELDPGLGDAWWGLANLKAYRFGDADRAAMEARLVDPSLPPTSCAPLFFALGKANEDRRDDARAFEQFARGNAIERQGRPYDAAQASALVRRSKAVFTPAFFAERAGWGWDAPDPIFIVGLPRSGSSLVEQILASHPLVEGAGELADIALMAEAIARLPPPQSPGAYPDQIVSLPARQLAAMGHDYLERTRARRRLGRARFTDKAPANFLHAGLIHLMLPRARIIDVRRHPLACCLSAFQHHFAQGFDFTHDLTDLGRYYADYVALMAHFDAVLPGRVLRVTYEALVEDMEAEVRRLLDHLELSFEPACLRFFENPRPVATPSSEQVRWPVFREALDHWRRFEPWLGPLKTALGPVLETYPEAPPTS